MKPRVRLRRVISAVDEARLDERSHAGWRRQNATGSRRRGRYCLSLPAAAVRRTLDWRGAHARHCRSGGRDRHEHERQEKREETSHVSLAIVSRWTTPVMSGDAFTATWFTSGATAMPRGVGADSLGEVLREQPGGSPARVKIRNPAKKSEVSATLPHSLRQGTGLIPCSAQSERS